MNKKMHTKLTASLAALVTGISMLTFLSPVQAAPTLDGKTSETAASSCYEIKQNDPSSESGAYWLYTPEMSAPAQFYCDQETDGGGWVMIGRGRDGWTEEYSGKGDANQLATNPDGTDAFTPVQLPSTTVDALLNGQSPSDLEDGMRVRRAFRADGSAYQEVRAQRGESTRWSWALGSNAPWQNITFTDPDSSARNYGTSTKGIAAFDTRTLTMSYQGKQSQGYRIGFGYGAYSYGTTDASSYLWSKDGGGYALPFAQVYLRPKLLSENLDYGSIADTGAAGSARTALPNSYSSKMVWRTSEKTATGRTGEMNTYVQAITQVDNNVFIGGDYAYVESASGERVEQSYLTGYDVNSGELNRDFRPTFNGQIKSLAPLPDGKLAVGGEFTKVNGQSAPGFVLLNAADGTINNDWNWGLENRVSGLSVTVKSMDVQGEYLYIAGSFTHVRGSATNNPTYARNLARYNINTGAVDWKWRPVFNGTVNGVSASEDGSTVYAAGYFGTVNGETATRLAALNASDASRKANWDWEFSYPDRRAVGGFQFDVQDAGSTVFAGGAEHLISQYDATTFARTNSSITRNGGDFQDLSKNGNTIYGACHCGNWIYDGGEKYDNPWDQAHDVFQIRLLAAFNATTGEVEPEFNPQLRGASGFGIWESFTDSTGTLWVGGDLNSSLGANGVQKTVGFARFNPRDIEAPAVPTGLTVSTADGKDKLTWNAVGSAKYQVLRDNRVVATVDSPSYEIDHTDKARYFVRTVDNSGNYSATTPVAVSGVVEEEVVTNPVDEATEEATEEPTDEATEEATEQPAEEATEEPTEEAVINDAANQEPLSEEVVAYGDTWSYKAAAWYTLGSWKNLSGYGIGWQQGASPIGWGNAAVTSRVGYTWYPPTVLYMRKNINFTDVATIEKLTLNTYADDGLVVYVNGQEVGRSNMPAGAAGYNAVALSPKETLETQQTPVTIEVPASLLREGDNVIAVSVHSAGSYSANATFDMSAELSRTA